MVANDPRAYRETLAAVVDSMRPRIEVTVVDPVDVEREFARLRPDLVIASRLSPTVEAGALSWVVLYPEGQRRVDVSVAGTRSVAGDLELPALLEIVDRTEMLGGDRGPPVPVT